MPIRKTKAKGSKATQILAWSYSRFSKYRSCPAAAKFSAIDKIREPSSDAMKRGTRIHKEAEDYSTGKTNKRPKSLDLFPDEFKALRKIKSKLQVEQNLAVDKSWGPCGYFDANVWLRVKMDCMFVMKDPGVLKIIDYKTGQHLDWGTNNIKADHLEQLSLYGAAGFIFGGPQIERIEAEMWYLDQKIIWGAGDGEPMVFERSDEMKLRREWEGKAKPMLRDKKFKPNPGDACKAYGGCFFSKAKGGPCEY